MDANISWRLVNLLSDYCEQIIHVEKTDLPVPAKDIAILGVCKKTQTPADYNVQCLENVELLQFPYEQLQELYMLIPKLERFFRIIIQKAYVASEKCIINLS